MLKTLRTVVYSAPDLEKAKAWYQEVLGYPPQVDERFYVGFAVGEGDLGLDPDTNDTPGGNAGVVAYWEVDDVPAAVQRLLGLGATPRGEIQEMGGIRVATVLDPFGNILGLIKMPAEDAA